MLRASSDSELLLHIGHIHSRYQCFVACKINNDYYFPHAKEKTCVAGRYICDMREKENDSYREAKQGLKER